MRDQYTRAGQGFVLVYAVTARESFEDLVKFRGQIFGVKGREPGRVLLIGNKCEMNANVQCQCRPTAGALLGIPFFETSALKRVNVDQSFFKLVLEIRRENTAKESPKKSCQARL